MCAGGFLGSYTLSPRDLLPGTEGEKTDVGGGAVCALWRPVEGPPVIFSEVVGAEARVSHCGERESGSQGPRTLWTPHRGFPSCWARWAGHWKKTVGLPQGWGFAGPMQRRTRTVSELVGR